MRAYGVMKKGACTLNEHAGGLGRGSRESIAWRASRGERQSDLAEEFRVNQSTISRIVAAHSTRRVLPDLEMAKKTLATKFLTEEDRIEIGRLRKMGYSQKRIAESFGVNASTVSRALR